MLERSPLPDIIRAPALVLVLLATLVACTSADEPAEPAASAPAVIIAGPNETGSGDASGEDGGEGAPDPGSSATPEPVSLDWLAGDVPVPGLSGPVAAPVFDAALQDVVARALGGFTGQASVVVHNLADGRYAAVNESRIWYAASTFKAAVLLEAYRQRDAGEIDFATEVVLEEKYAENDLGTLEYLGLEPNDKVRIGDAVKGMIVVSDTPLALLVVDQLGSKRIDATLDAIGATVMTVNDTALPTTALDLARVLIAIAAGQGVSTASRDEMLSLLAQEWFTQGVAAGLPPGTAYAHKSGSFGDAIHDAAIVWGPAGPYVITVMTDGSAGWEPIAAVSAAVYEYFSAD